MKKGMKLNFIRVISAVLILAMVAAFIPSITSLADDKDFTANVQVGFGNEAEVGKYVPFYITVENHSKDFEGTMQVIIAASSKENYMYEQNVTISSGTKKTVPFIIPVKMKEGKMNVRLVNKKGKVVWNKIQRFTVNASLYNVNVGILSGDYAALGYMDRQTFNGNSNFITKIYELDENSFTDDWHALDMLDVMVISDYSTDLLTDGQIRALIMWIDKGGLLLVGTGSTSSKTLSGLNGQVFEVTPGKLQSKDTKLGLSLKNFTYSYTVSNDSGNGYGYAYAEDDEEYIKDFEELFENEKDYFEETYRQSFNSWWGYDIDDEEWQDSSIQEFFKDYCRDEFYQIYLEEKMNDEVDSNSDILNAPSIRADVLQMTAEKESDVMVGEDMYGGVYDLHHIFNIGSGYAVVSGIDYTKNPIPGYSYSSLFFIDIIETLIGQSVVDEANNANGYYSYYSNNQTGFNYESRQYLNKVGGAPVPPVLIYFVIIGLFFVSVFVMFFIFLKRKRSFRLWMWYPIVAAGVALLVYCVGFSTRLVRPSFDMDTIICLGDKTFTETNYAVFTAPRNKDYKISFSNNYQVSQDTGNDYYFWDNEEGNPDLDKYSKSFNMSNNDYGVVLNNLAPLDGEQFIISTIDFTDRNIAVNYPKKETNFGAEKISITNNVGFELENVVVFVDDGSGYSTYILGDMKLGETIDLKGKKNTEIYNSYYLSTAKLNEQVFPKLDSQRAGALFVGSLSPAFREGIAKARAFDWVKEIIEDIPHQSGNVCVVAFPKGHMGGDVQVSTKYSGDRTEILYKVEKTEALITN